MSDLLPHPQDGCPSCITRRRTVIVTPAGVQRDLWTLRAEYLCPQCGHHWHTWWNPDTLGEAGEQGAAA